MEPQTPDMPIAAGHLPDAKMVSLLAVWMLVAFFYFLNRHTKRQYFKVWTLGWVFYGVWLALNYELPDAKAGGWVSLGEQWCLAFSSVLLFWGSLRFQNLSGRQILFAMMMVFLLGWTLISPHVFSGKQLVIELPVFMVIGLCSAFAGLCFFRMRMRMPYIGAGMLSVGFQLWALYLASYPVAQQYKSSLTAHFYVGTLLQLFIAISMVVVMLEEVRLNAQEMRTEMASVRSEKEELLAKVLSSEEECRNLYNQIRLSEGVQKAYDELRRTQDSVAQKERLAALGQMASGVAHDINNVLSPILGYSELMLSRISGIPEEARKYLEIMKGSCDDVAQILARMRGFYQGRSDPKEMGEANVNKIIKDVVEVTRPRWHDIPLREGIEIKIEFNLESDLPILYGNPEELQEGIFNLIFNAVDAMPGGGTITITTKFVDVPTGPSAEKHGKSQLRIEVRDNGVGMDERTRQRCLEPFFSTKSARGQTGLGLAMVYGMMQRHEGTIQIESTRALGTTVLLTFPFRKPPPTAPLRSNSRPLEKQSVKVLCIDDEPRVRQLLDVCLTHYGHKVGVASGGKEGLELFRSARSGKEPFQVVITDMGMPDVDGRQVVETISSESRSTPIIMMTGWGTMMREENATPPAVAALIDKPPHIQELNELLLKLTDKNGS